MVKGCATNEIIKQVNIENKILVVRNYQVMIDRDLAELYGVETKVLNQAVKRNIERFPENFMFRLNNDERKELVTNCDRFEMLKHSRTSPYAFTEQDVAKFNAQYPNLILNYTKKMHDRFLIIDNTLLYHVGASLKDLGKKCFAFEILDSGLIPAILKNV